MVALVMQEPLSTPQHKRAVVSQGRLYQGLLTLEKTLVCMYTIRVSMLRVSARVVMVVPWCAVVVMATVLSQTGLRDQVTARSKPQTQKISPPCWTISCRATTSSFDLRTAVSVLFATTFAWLFDLLSASHFDALCSSCFSQRI